MTKSQSQAVIAELASMIEYMYHSGGCLKAIDILQKRIMTIQLKLEQGKR